MRIFFLEAGMCADIVTPKNVFLGLFCLQGVTFKPSVVFQKSYFLVVPIFSGQGFGLGFGLGFSLVSIVT
jgi:hypothetical protein